MNRTSLLAATLWAAISLLGCDTLFPPLTCDDDPTLDVCQPLGIKLVANATSATCTCEGDNPDAGVARPFTLTRDMPGVADDNSHLCPEHTRSIVCEGTHNQGADFVCTGGGDNNRPGKAFPGHTSSGCEFRSSKAKMEP